MIQRDSEAGIGIRCTEYMYPKYGKMVNFYRGQIFKVGPPLLEYKHYCSKPMSDYDELKRLTTNMIAQIKDSVRYNTQDT